MRNRILAIAAVAGAMAAPIAAQAQSDTVGIVRGGTVIMHLDCGQIAAAVRRLLGVVKPSGILYLSWRITDKADLRDAQGRLYAAFDTALVQAELKTTALLLDEEVVSASSGKKIHRLVAKKPGLEIRE